MKEPQINLLTQRPRPWGLGHICGREAAGSILHAHPLHHAGHLLHSHGHFSWDVCLMQLSAVSGCQLPLGEGPLLACCLPALLLHASGFLAVLVLVLLLLN